jgi:pyruvate carboxylase
MPGIVAKVFVKAGQEVKAGDVLVAIESMKMEYAVKATHNAVVEALYVEEGKFVEQKASLLRLK